MNELKKEQNVHSVARTFRVFCQGFRKHNQTPVFPHLKTTSAKLNGSLLLANKETGFPHCLSKKIIFQLKYLTSGEIQQLGTPDLRARNKGVLSSSSSFYISCSGQFPPSSTTYSHMQVSIFTNTTLWYLVFVVHRELWILYMMWILPGAKAPEKALL